MSRSKRNRNRVSYFEPEEPSFHDYIFCSECGDYVYEYCSIHGPLLVIPDDEVPSPTGLPPPPPAPRAAFTIPRNFLHLAPSTIPDAGIGVFSTLTLLKGVRFGPYRGLKTDKVTSSYCWQIFDKNRKQLHSLDARDPGRSNWMRYVNCSRHFSEQNLLAFQYKGQLYYRTIKIIPRFTELLVFYGSEFANELNIDLRRYHSSTFEKPLVKRELEDDSQETRTEIKIVKCFSIVKPEPELGPKDVRDTQIPEMKLIKRFSTVKSQQDDEEKTHIPEMKLVKYEMDDIEQNTPIPMHPLKGISLKNESDDKQELTTSQEMQLDTDTVVDAKENGLQNLDSMELVQNIHYESELFTDSLRERNKENIDSNDFETKYNINCGESFDQNKPNGLVMQNVATDLSKVKKYSCQICKTAFITKSELINHDIKTHDSKKTYKACTICDYKTENNRRLKQHIETHRNEKYKCDICGYETQYLLYMQRHKRTHVCKFCHQIFKNGDQLRKHLRRVHELIN